MLIDLKKKEIKNYMNISMYNKLIFMFQFMTLFFVGTSIDDGTTEQIPITSSVTNIETTSISKTSDITPSDITPSTATIIRYSNNGTIIKTIDMNDTNQIMELLQEIYRHLGTN